MKEHKDKPSIDGIRKPAVSRALVLYAPKHPVRLRALKYAEEFFRPAIAAILLVALVFSGIAVPRPALGATFTFVQSNWNNQTANTAADPTDQSNWTQFSAKDANMATGTALALKPANIYAYKASGYRGKIFCLDANTCWVADGGNRVEIGSKIIKKTTDGGATWSFTETPVISGGVNASIEDIQFADANTGYAVYYPGAAATNLIIKSTDGGASWSFAANLPVSTQAIALRIIDANTVVVTTQSNATGEIFKTTNGGTSWSTVANNCGGSDLSINAAYFPTALIGFAAGNTGAICKTTDGGANWTSLSTTTTDFLSIYFADANTGWAAGDDKIYKTTDGGSNWILQKTISSNIDSVRCADANTCWLGITGGYSYKTTDGGTNWSNQALPAGAGGVYGISVINTTNAFTSNEGGGVYKTTNGSSWSAVSPYVGNGITTPMNISFFDQNTGFASMRNLQYWNTTTDGGTTWISSIGSNMYSNEIYFVSSTVGWAAVPENGIYKTTNGGTSWTQQLSAVAISLEVGQNGFHFLNATTGWFAGTGAGAYARTTDGGTNWTTGTTGSVQWRDVYFVDANTGWMVGKSGNITKSTDGGVNWNAQTSGTSNQLEGTHCLDVNTCWAVGASGKIIKTVDGGANWTAQTSGVSVTLYDVYFVNANVGFTAGDDSTILTTADGGTTWSNTGINMGNGLGDFQKISASGNTIYVGGEFGVILKIVSNYPSSQTLTSSAYNSGSDSNIIGSLSWNEDASLPSGTTVTISLRTAATSGGLTGAWTDFTNATSGCSKSAATTTCSSSAIPSAMKDGSGDRWFQYKVTLTSTGANTPTVGEVDVQYVVNAPPEFDATFGTNGVSVSQISDSGSADWGKVQIQYKVLDSDTANGANQYKITPSLEYNIGGGWVAITSGYLAAGDLSDKTVAAASYTTHTATWDAKSQISGNYLTTAQVRVTANDGEGANATAQATSGNFTLDTTNPTVTTFTIDSTADTLSLNLSDNTNIEYRLSNDSSFTGVSWTSVGATSYTATPSWTLTGAPSYEKVYLQVRDVYGNTSSPTAVAPLTPTNLDIRDTSNVNTDTYREFLSWAVFSATTSSAFSKYELYRKTDSGSYSLLTTITNSATNFYTDTSVASTSAYTYKIRYVDTANDVGNYSSEVSDTPDGQGGTDFTAPTITSITVASSSATWAKITWTTDELSNSEVGYSVSPSTAFSSTASSTSYVTRTVTFEITGALLS